MAEKKPETVTKEPEKVEPKVIKRTPSDLERFEEMTAQIEAELGRRAGSIDRSCCREVLAQLRELARIFLR